MNTELIQHMVRYAATLSEQAVQNVLTANIAMSHFLRLFDGEIHSLI